MPGGETPSVCVVGAGAIGLASALELARRGVRSVRVIDARRVAAGSSGRSAGIVETQYLDPLDIELRVRSMRSFERLEREHGLRVVRNGYLRLAREERHRADFQASVELQRELGVSDTRVLEREQIGRLVPDMLLDDVDCALFGAGDGYLQGRRYCELLAELAAANGVELLLGCELLGAEPRTGGGLCLSTSNGPLDCDLAIDAAGPWAGEVAELLGCRLDLIAQRQQASSVQLPRRLRYVMPSVMDYTPGSGQPGVYFRHERSDCLIAGLHAEDPSGHSVGPDDYDHEADQRFLEDLTRELARRLPSLRGARLVGGWAGLYPCDAGGRPLVGPLGGDAGVIAVAGAGSGVQLSPVLGELVADWALEGEPLVVAEARELAPTRYG